MINSIRRFCLAAMIAVLWTAPSTVNGQSPKSADLSYSRGVQSYFSGIDLEAEQFLNEAIAENPDDPRPYYFRALSLIRLGRSDEARADMLAGGQLEAERPGRYPIGKSLERVQGSDRLLLEEYRRRARAANTTLQNDRRRTRYEPNVAHEADVLRQKLSVPLDQLTQPSSLGQWSHGRAGAESSAEPAPLAGPTDRGAPKQPTGPLSDPFADDAQSSAPSDAETDNPFAIDEGVGGTSHPGDANVPQGGKISAGKLMGIFGRVLSRSAPVPSLEGLPREVPFVSGSHGKDNSMAPVRTVGPPTDADSFEDSASSESPAADMNGNAARQDNAPDPASKKSEDEDPFGGF